MTKDRAIGDYASQATLVLCMGLTQTLVSEIRRHEAAILRAQDVGP